MKRHLEIRGSMASQPHSISKEEDNIVKRMKRRQELLQESPNEWNINKRNLHPRDLRIRFTEADHKYTDENGVPFRMSVTGMKKLCTPDFDLEECIKSKFTYPEWSLEKNCFVVGKKNAKSKDPKDYGLSRQEIITKMKKKTEVGTKVHRLIEQYFLRPEWQVGLPTETRMELLVKGESEVSDIELNCLNQFLIAEDHILADGWRPKRVEHRIYAEDLNLAGSVDMVWENEDRNIIVDWKTTDKDPQKPYNWKVPNFDYPLSHVKNSLLNEYFLQMSIYGVIYTKYYEWNVTEVWAVVLNTEKFHVYGSPIYKSPLLHREVELLFDCWKRYLDLEGTMIKWIGLEGSKQRLTLLSMIPGFGPWRCTQIVDAVNQSFITEGNRDHDQGPDSTDYTLFCAPRKLFTVAHLLIYGKMRFRQKARQRRIMKEKTELSDHNEWYEICQNIELLLREIGISSDETICNLLSMVCGMDVLDLSLHTMKEDGSMDFFPCLRGDPVAFKPILTASTDPKGDALCLLKHMGVGTFGEIVSLFKTKGPADEDNVQIEINGCLSRPIYNLRDIIENEIRFY
jgi:PD-(D/E)XK nuclease superfamily